MAKFEIIAKHGVSKNQSPYVFSVEFVAVPYPHLTKIKQVKFLSLGIDSIKPIPQTDVPSFELPLVNVKDLYPETEFEISVEFFGKESCFWFDKERNKIIG